MKKILLLILTAFSLVALKAQVATQAADALEIKQAEFDFGKIPQGKPVFHYFDIVNTSDKAFKLDNVQASCGCTTPEWNKDEIPAGATSRIKVGYNAASGGTFEKYITVTYNGNATKQIKIKGEVWQAPAGPAPVNNSIQFLKQQIQ